jgi:predicted flap endonuclease-1-like 5' DNA nuclease
MIVRGVPREAISAVGYGPSKPLADNATEASRAANRRTKVRWAQQQEWKDKNMFREWGFLISEMVVLILLVALLGLFVGWLIWGRWSSMNVDTGKADRLHRELDACKAKHFEKDARIAALGAEASASVSAAHEADVTSEGVLDYDGDGILQGENEGSKPATLDGARDDVADDLKQIKGIGPKMDKICNALGLYHFDQIAAWTPDEEAWVNANLEGFKGRMIRDQWTVQAKLLAAGGETEFSKRAEGGDVY